MMEGLHLGEWSDEVAGKYHLGQQLWSCFNTHHETEPVHSLTGRRVNAAALLCPRNPDARTTVGKWSCCTPSSTAERQRPDSVEIINLLEAATFQLWPLTPHQSWIKTKWTWRTMRLKGFCCNRNQPPIKIKSYCATMSGNNPDVLHMSMPGEMLLDVWGLWHYWHCEPLNTIQSSKRNPSLQLRHMSTTIRSSVVPSTSQRNRSSLMFGRNAAPSTFFCRKFGFSISMTTLWLN